MPNYDLLFVAVDDRQFYPILFCLSYICGILTINLVSKYVHKIFQKGDNNNAF
jgi:hypothetical protein